MKCVVLESPYAGDIEINVAYAKLCLRDSILRGEAPIASHLLFPQTFNDANPQERMTCMAAGHAWIWAAESLVVYMDLGISKGMQAGIDIAIELGIPHELRTLGTGWWNDPA